MSRTRAHRRASSTAPSEQHPECRGSTWLSCQICIVPPITSCPRRLSRAATTALSTPPDIATQTVLRRPSSLPPDERLVGLIVNHDHETPTGNRLRLHVLRKDEERRSLIDA